MHASLDYKNHARNPLSLAHSSRQGLLPLATPQDKQATCYHYTMSTTEGCQCGHTHACTHTHCTHMHAQPDLCILYTVTKLYAQCTPIYPYVHAHIHIYTNILYDNSICLTLDINEEANKTAVSDIASAQPSSG